ncbi:hypothetical protein EIP91_004316 [Steccherinum ochraceum]|uniref:Uncharacterized protein n=1 Tax=Steccherinum ochraceum TaxID=92696 RepID=A0A4V2MW01_9APHY|nr:hypothetical protein EIP91_004316 [Steccherinum ochraceum]
MVTVRDHAVNGGLLGLLLKRSAERRTFSPPVDPTAFLFLVRRKEVGVLMGAWVSHVGLKFGHFRVQTGNLAGVVHMRMIDSARYEADSGV